MSEQRTRVASGTVASALQMGIGFVTIIVFGRLVGNNQLGLYFFVLSIVSTTDGLLNGFIAACKKRISEHDAPVRELLGLVLVVTIPAAIVLSGLVGGVLVAFDLIDADVTLLFAIAFVPFVASTAAVRMVVGLGRVDAAQWLQTARTVLRAIVQLALILVGLGAVGLVVGHAIAMTLGAAAALLFVGIVPRLPAIETVRSVGEFARYSVPGGVISRIDESADEMILGIMFAAGVVGDYGVAVRLVAPALLVSSVIQGSLAARLSDLDSRGEPVAHVIRKNLAFTAILSIPICFGALAIGDHVVVTAFGSEFGGAAPFLVILAASRVVKSFASPMTSAIAGFDLPRRLLVVNAISAVTVLVGAPVLAVAIGPIGVAVAIFLSTVVRCVLSALVLLSRVGRRSLVPRQVGEQVLAGFVMFWCVAAADRLLITDWLAVVLTVLIGGIVYGVVLLVVSPETRAATVKFVNKAFYTSRPETFRQT
jgi:O-antigen/teichoic acid export membrane protein